MTPRPAGRGVIRGSDTDERSSPQADDPMAVEADHTRRARRRRAIPSATVSPRRGRLTGPGSSSSQSPGGDEPMEEPMTTTEPARTSLRDKQRDWYADNPLRRWRRRENLTRADAASLIDASASSVQQWEQGGWQPNDESLAQIAAALGIKTETLRRQWRAWYNSRPGAR